MSDVLDKYMLEINKNDILSKEELFECFNKKEYNKIIKSNLKFVVFTAKKYEGKGLPIEDLINEGNLGLIHAIDKFDISRDCTFITFAIHWIKHYMIKAIYDYSRAIRIPIKTDYNNIKDDFIYVNNISDNNELERLNTTTIDFNEEESLIKDELKRLMGNLSDRERLIIQSYYGVGVDVESNLEDIGNTLNLTKMRINQIKDNAIRKLRYNSNRLEKIKNDIY